MIWWNPFLFTVFPLKIAIIKHKQKEITVSIITHLLLFLCNKEISPITFSSLPIPFFFAVIKSYYFFFSLRKYKEENALKVILFSSCQGAEFLFNFFLNLWEKIPISSWGFRIKDDISDLYSRGSTSNFPSFCHL